MEERNFYVESYLHLNGEAVDLAFRNGIIRYCSLEKQENTVI